MTALANLPDMDKNANEPYRFTFRNAYEIDFLPFGSIADEMGRVELKAKKTFVLDIPGFDAVKPYAETIETEEGLRLKVSSLPGVVLLKLFAWQDRPEREKDIQDIDHIIKHFLPLHWEEISAEPDDLFGRYENETTIFEHCVSARFVGRQIGGMLSNHMALKNRLLRLLDEQSSGYGMARLMSPEFLEHNQRIIRALFDGMNDA